jgi:uncharacterized membrane protein YhaH (DUF805 family)
MSGTAAPIELAPRRRRPRAPRVVQAIRASARSVHLFLALAIILGVFLQVYLIGSYLFGAGQGALDAHMSVGWTVHGLEVLVLLAALVAWLPWRDLGLSALLAVIGTVQVSLASEQRWIGGLHPLLALVVLGLATTLALRGFRRGRRAASSSARARTSTSTSTTNKGGKHA